MTRESWRASVTWKEELRVPVAPIATYRFNSRALLNAEFRSSARTELVDFVARHDLPPAFGAAIDDRSVQAIVPGPEQVEVFDLLHFRDPGRLARADDASDAMPPFICIVVTQFIVCLIAQQNVSDLDVE